MTIIERLFSALNKGKIRYLVIGGVAVNLYGVERATRDIDLFVDLDEENLFRFVEVVESLNLKPKIPVKFNDFTKKEIREKWVRDKNMMVFSMFDSKNPYFLLDVFIEEPFAFTKAYKERMEGKIGRTVVPVISIKHLIKIKEKSNRPQDIADIFYLKEIKKEFKNG